MIRVTSRRSGFTIVELLVVVVVIAILAAITIVSYNGITHRAKSSLASSAAAQAAKKVSLYFIENGDVLPSSLTAAGIAGGESVSYQYRTYNSGKNYCITATSSGTSYFINNDTNANPTAGACAGHGGGGAVAIANLAANPRATVLSNTGQGRWAYDRYGADGTYSIINTVTDHPAGITTAARFTVAVPRVSHGFHLANNPQISQPSGGSGFESALPVSSGKTYTISAWVRKSGSAQDFQFQLRCAVDAANWYEGYTNGPSVRTSAGQWARASVSYLVPPTCTRLYIGLIGAYTADNVGDTIDGTGLMITEGSTLHSYADGSAPGWAWSGDAHNSPSTGPAL